LPSTRTCVFDRLQPSSSTKRPSVFTRIGAPKSSVFNKIKKGTEPLKAPPQDPKGSVFNSLGDTSEVQSFIPSRMKRFSTLDIKTEGSLRVKRHTVIFTGQRSNPDSKKREAQDEVAPSHHITV